MASDTCPGAQVALSPSTTAISLTGTTTGAKDDYKTFCADASAATSAPDVVYELDVTGVCTLDIKLSEQGSFDGAFSLRKGMCDMRAGGDLCVNQATHGEETKLEVTPGTYYLVVDGANKTSGDFAITLKCTTPACGDGVLNSSEEQCEPASATDPNCGQPGSGVNACKILESPSADTCPGTGISLSKAAGVVHVPSAPPGFNTASAADNYIDMTCSPGTGAPDEVFQINPTDTGKLIVMIGRDGNGGFADPVVGDAAGMTTEGANDGCKGPLFDQNTCWIHNIYLRSGADCASSTTIKPANCNPGATPTGPYTTVPISQCGYQCANPTFDNAVSIISADVTAGTPVWLFVDGLDGSNSGPYTLTMQIQ